MKLKIEKFPGNYMFRLWDQGNFHIQDYLGNFRCNSADIGNFLIQAISGVALDFQHFHFEK